MRKLEKLNEDLGPLSVKFAAVEGDGYDLIREYERKGLNVDSVREEFQKVCNADVD